MWEEALYSAFPRLFAVTTNKDALVADVGLFKRGRGPVA